MFTGIVSDIGTVEAVEQRGDTRVRIATASSAGNKPSCASSPIAWGKVLMPTPTSRISPDCS